LVNGYYIFKLSQTGSAPLSAGLWIQRDQAQLSSALIYPNPVQQAPLRVRLNSAAAVVSKGKIYTLAGEQVAVLETQPAAADLIWNLKTASGKTAASGVYYLMLEHSAPGGLLQRQWLRFA